MNKCNGCNVTVHAQHRHCPLCGVKLGQSGQSITVYPRYDNPTGKAVFTMQKLLIFLAIAASAISGFINIFTQTSFPWSAFVILSLFSIWLIVGTLRSKDINEGKKILNCYGVVFLLLVAIDAFSGFYKWSTTYVIPFLTIAVALVLTVLAMRSSKHFTQYLGCLIAVFFISLCPTAIYLFSLSTEAWSSLVAMLYCLLTVAGLWIFKGGSFKQEMKKRFYF
jgi:heme exporter protein D